MDSLQEVKAQAKAHQEILFIEKIAFSEAISMECDNSGLQEISFITSLQKGVSPQSIRAWHPAPLFPKAQSSVRVQMFRRSHVTDHSGCRLPKLAHAS